MQNTILGLITVLLHFEVGLSRVQWDSSNLRTIGALEQAGTPMLLTRELVLPIGETPKSSGCKGFASIE